MLALVTERQKMREPLAKYFLARKGLVQELKTKTGPYLYFKYGTKVF